MRSDRAASLAPEPSGSGCTTCDPHGRPGYVPAVSTFGEGVPVWRRCPAYCGPANQQQAAARRAARAAYRPAPRATVPAPAPEPRPVARRQESAAPARRRRPAASAAPARELVPVLLVDADGGELVHDVPGLPGLDGAKTLAALFAWLGSGLPLGVDKLHKDARAWDPVVILSAAAAELVKLPAKMPAAKAMERLAAKVAKAAADAGMEIGALGPGTKVYRRKSETARKVSLSLLLTPWLGQGTTKQINGVHLASLLAETPDGPDAVALARRLRTFVGQIGITPGASEATTSMMLLESVRPREEWSAERGRYVLKPSAFPGGDTCVPVAAGGRHPLTRELLAAGERICEEEDYKHWTRPLTADESLLPWAVTVDVSTSYLSVTARLGLPQGPLELTDAPHFDGKRAGLWLCDFTGITVEPELPHPSEWTGHAPTGPGWYATPTVEYMAKSYGFDVATIAQAYVSTHTVSFLEEWTGRIRDAYKASMAVLGVVDGMEPGAFLAAYAARKDGAEQDAERADALVLASAYKNIYKGGVGRWTYNAATIDDDAEWLERVAARWWYRPEVRFHIIAAARIALHRRMRKTLELTGLAPFMVNVDALMYASSEPSPFPLLPTKPDGSPERGALRLGAAPGSFKHESSVPMAAVLAAVAEGVHPARLIHDFTAAGDPATTEEEATRG
jgi:hypothetical protein